MTSARELTDAYEAWLASAIELDPAELARKHAEMAEHEYRFLRGSYYLWLVRIGELVPETLAGLSAPLIGDLHVENFGTWRDVDQRRRWGVNDFDELAVGAVLPDLVRLATSAVLAPHIAAADKDICDLVLTSWSEATPGVSVDLAEKGASHLLALVPPFDDAEKFYADLAEGSLVQPPAEVVSATMAVAEPGWRPTWHRHVAGTGSLGHRRVVGVGAAADGGTHAREAKQLGRGTAHWVRSTTPGLPWPTPSEGIYDRVRAGIEGPAAATRVSGWQVRDLAPDIVRIELAGLAHHDTERLLRAMARAAADVHGCGSTSFEDLVEDVGRFGKAAFRDAVQTMVASTQRDFAAYRT